MNQSRPGEFELIHQLTRGLPKYRREVVNGIGDDCAVLKLKGDKYLLLTCDVQVEGAHFFAKKTMPEIVGQRAVSVNISDIAAMGGKPTYCLVSLITPKKLSTDYIEALYRGIKSTCVRSDIQIVGGNISSGRQLAIDIFMMGEVRPGDILTRKGAKPGDKLLVTGSLGGSAAGLEIIKNKIVMRREDKVSLIEKHLSPVPRLKESEIIAKSRMATSMIDISDGLASDVRHICNQSNVGVVINESQLPIPSGVARVEELLGLKPMSLALSGGEDYELLLTASPDAAEKIIKMVKSKTGTDVNIIGEIMPPDAGRWIFGVDGQMRPLIATGWDHLKENGIE